MFNETVSVTEGFINAGYNTKLNGFEVEIEEFGKSFGTKDFKEGVGAFLEKRKANFKGE